MKMSFCFSLLEIHYKTSCSCTHAEQFKPFFFILIGSFEKFPFNIQLYSTLSPRKSLFSFISIRSQTHRGKCRYFVLLSKSSFIYSTNHQCAHSILCILLLPPHTIRLALESLIDFFWLLPSCYYSSSPRRNKKLWKILKR